MLTRKYSTKKQSLDTTNTTRHHRQKQAQKQKSSTTGSIFLSSCFNFGNISYFIMTMWKSQHNIHSQFTIQTCLSTCTYVIYNSSHTNVQFINTSLNVQISAACSLYLFPSVAVTNYQLGFKQQKLARHVAQQQSLHLACARSWIQSISPNQTKGNRNLSSHNSGSEKSEMEALAALGPSVGSEKETILCSSSSVWWLLTILGVPCFLASSLQSQSPSSHCLLSISLSSHLVRMPVIEFKSHCKAWVISFRDL